MESENAYEVINTPETNPPVFIEPISSPLLRPSTPESTLPTLESEQAPKPILDIEEEINSNMNLVNDLISSFLVKLMGSSNEQVESTESDTEEIENEVDSEGGSDGESDGGSEGDSTEESTETHSEGDSDSNSEGDDSIYLIQCGNSFKYEDTYNGARKAIMTELCSYIERNSITFYHIENRLIEQENTEEFVIMERLPHSLYPFQMNEIFTIRIITTQRYSASP